MASNRDSIIGLGITVDGIEKLREFEALIQRAIRTKKGRQELLLALTTKGFEDGTKKAQRLVKEVQRQTEAVKKETRAEQGASSAADKRARALDRETKAQKRSTQAAVDRGVTVRRVGRTIDQVQRTADLRIRRQAQKQAQTRRQVARFAESERLTGAGRQRVGSFARSIQTERVASRLLGAFDPLIEARISGAKTPGQVEAALRAPFRQAELGLIRQRDPRQRDIKPITAQNQFFQDFRGVAEKIGRTPGLAKAFRSGGVIRRALPELSGLPAAQSAQILSQFQKINFGQAAQGTFAGGKQFAPVDVSRFLQIAEETGISTKEQFGLSQRGRLRKFKAGQQVLGKGGGASIRALLGIAGAGLLGTGAIVGSPLLAGAGLGALVGPPLVSKISGAIERARGRRTARAPLQ